MTKQKIIVEVLNAVGDQVELTLVKEEGKYIGRLNESDEVKNDILIISPAAHDLIDVLNHSTAGTPFIDTSHKNPFSEELQGGRDPEIAIQYKDKRLPVGPIDLLRSPVIGACIVEVTDHVADGSSHKLTGLVPLGKINFIDAREW